MDFETFAGHELSELAKRLVDAAARSTDAATARTAAGLQATIDTLRTDHEHAIDTLRTDYEQAADTLRTDHDRAIDTLRTDHDQKITKLRTAQEQAIDKLRTDHEQLSLENERLAAENAAAAFEKAALADSMQQLTDSTQQLTHAAQKNDRGHLLERLLSVFERIDRSTTPEEVLTAAAHGFVEDCSRMVAFMVRDDRLEAIHWHGLDLSSKPAGTVVSLTSDSLIALAACAHNVRVFDADTKVAVETPFGGTPSVIVTAPISVRGELTALLYADNAGLTAGVLEPENGLRLAGLLQRHTALRLERLTIELKAIAELRAYAQMLLDEVEYVHAGDIAGKKPEQEQVDRLAENLRCARQIFQQRVTVEGPAAATLLDEVITRTIETRSGTPFARHLGIAAARQSPAFAQAS